jgi:sensor histidine kinase YesM
MRWVLSVFCLRREPPPLREIPVLLLKSATFGAVLGPFLALFVMALTSPSEIPGFLTSPVSILGGAMTGTVFSLAFFICSGLGNSYLRPLVLGYPSGIVRTIYTVFNMVSSTMALTSASAVISWLSGGRIRILFPYLWLVFGINGIIAVVLAFVIGAFMKLRRQVEETQAKLREKEVETARAQARALQSQINPHFFFNTLNTISALIDDDPVAAKRTIGRLADMFRYTFGCTDGEAVGLDQEVQFVRDYLSIEQARFRKRLHVELPEGPLPNIRVPGLVLQPLVENAVKYGIAPRIEGGTVSVRIVGSRVFVRNTPGEEDRLEPANLFRSGHALDNVRARLRLFTGRADPLQVSSSSGWTEFSFEMRP